MHPEFAVHRVGLSPGGGTPYCCQRKKRKDPQSHWTGVNKGYAKGVKKIQGGLRGSDVWDSVVKPNSRHIYFVLDAGMEKRRLRGDMEEIYKYLNGDPCVSMKLLCPR